MLDSATLLAQLAHCSGTHSYFRHWSQQLLYTDGIQSLAEGAECYWLVDAIASHQPFLKRNHSQTHDYQTWQLNVSPVRMASLTCALDDEAIALRQEILFTTFPLPQITLFCFNGILLLPSEN